MPEPISQTEYWNGEVGERWARMQAELDRVFAPLTEDFLGRLALRPGEHALDIGCGCGETALLAAARLGLGGSVTAVDVSRPMLDRARARPHAGAPITWIEADAQTHPFAPRHDLALSRFGVMFFDQSEAAFANIRRGLRGGGRLAILCWRGLAENAWVALPRAAVLTVVPEPEPMPPGSPGPFRFADPGEVAGVLARAGFAAVATQPVDHALVLGQDAAEAARFALTVGPVSALLRDLDPALRERAAEVVRAAMPQAGPVRLAAACWLVTAVNPG
ncbi:2-methoxy-6-polyprenyl-1,4-benzoquinol methylase, mitochondrial [Methylobacterium crusticola]|uniref:2-methoxy-6-polyprenyl-1,4-benzoquinol methylase, mitochondrial n=1 Tax=Methylobacterium crusticola TaxID=1697972 RepID=A0ABQ4R2G5_9HYPH|nr:class I SAM-dependent methyltransferase [Methylobacterium crusticola]GJD51863.1 2-methoxy-6-polyprenyl-1,4-benzoquinol methylase, mitochondrial [Methylobacterium crusticola]